MEEIEAAEAQSRFDEIIDKVTRGETVIILRQGSPIARFRPPLMSDQAGIDVIAILEPPTRAESIALIST